ncbi:aromatic ring-hydroxylating dioxygenase subunit alpha [Pseudonocardia lutea]|jgi:choline monooxygenase|uniref:Aromatic ring-hydroxylating dioxygenase subunit alpha n=1 Tax=Pseudonocardia lutea TaxID=2172015 RepID=A0ABW1IA58_9PSEU
MTAHLEPPVHAQPDMHAALPARPVPAADFTDEHTYRYTRLPVELAATLPPDAYTSPEFFALEREKVFASSWVAVGCTAELDRPGACLVAEVAGRSIIVTRNREGRLRAFHNVCRHRATQLLPPDARHVGRHDRIRCPYHAWTYDLDGACLGTPLFEGSDIPPGEETIFDTASARAFDRADHGLLEVAVDTWGFLVFVHLAPDAAPLARHLGDLPTRFAGHRLDQWLPQRRRTYDVAANYKLVAENFMEYYHLPWVHPELTKVSRFSDHYRWQGPGLYTGMCTTPVSANTAAGGWDGLRPMSGLGEQDAVSGRFVWLFPNTALVVLPNHAFVLFAGPLGPARTRETAVILGHPESLDDPAADAALDQLESFWDLVNRQDLEIVERVQQGLENPAYRGGRMCYRFEEPLHRFQNMVVDRMVGLDRIPDGDDDTMTRMFPDP